jgi:hypothetical protein
MPWLDDEIPDWDDLEEEDKEALREIVRELGMEFPDDEDDGYYE